MFFYKNMLKKSRNTCRQICNRLQSVLSSQIDIVKKEKEIQMGKFEQEAKDLLAAIGGKENVTAVTHCATRMRFVLGDDKKADANFIYFS